METGEEKIEQFLRGNNLINIWFNHLIKDNSYTGSHTSLLPTHQERLKVFKRDLAEAGIPEKDIPYWSEKLLLYLEYRLKKALPGGDMDSDENFKWYQEKVKHEKANLYWGLAVLILIGILFGIFSQ